MSLASTSPYWSEHGVLGRPSRERLARIKKTYDPDNFFSTNTHIVPA